MLRARVCAPTTRADRYERDGIGLPDEQRAALKALVDETTRLETAFGQNAAQAGGSLVRVPKVTFTRRDTGVRYWCSPWVLGAVFQADALVLRNRDAGTSVPR